MSVPAFHRVRVLGRKLLCRTTRTTEHDWALHFAIGHVVNLGSVVDDLVHGEDREAHGHELDDRSKARHRRTRCNSCESGFGDGSVDNASVTVFRKQALGDLKRSLVSSNILAHQEHVCVLIHLLDHALVKSLSEGHL